MPTRQASVLTSSRQTLHVIPSNVPQNSIKLIQNQWCQVKKTTRIVSSNEGLQNDSPHKRRWNGHILRQRRQVNPAKSPGHSSTAVHTHHLPRRQLTPKTGMPVGSGSGSRSRLHISGAAPGTVSNVGLTNITVNIFIITHPTPLPQKCFPYLLKAQDHPAERQSSSKVSDAKTVKPDGEEERYE
ncbi:hypothetical protein RRG08_055138 [Elysia crispata]|uniref:Uncharacterized protein n=1 Tax=Elysia crispata TaxID=231223 RepID=A0AAE1CR33_9GAST|nr:hypothetical protein RRG08_055138 [Elysia crispata]